MSCSSGCPTPGTHDTYGECLRAKSLEIQNPEAHKHNQTIRRTQDEYVNARRAGLQPATPFKKDIDQAWRITEKTGVPFRADA